MVDVMLISQSIILNLNNAKFLKEILLEVFKMGELSKLLNIGKVLEEQLNEVGINTVDVLIDIGSKESWLKIKEIDDSVCINRLMALEGAIQNIRWHDLYEVDKNNLKEFYNNFNMD